MKSKTLILLLLLFLSIPSLYAYEESIRESIFLVRPENQFIPELDVPSYLEDEDLTFFACLETENTPIRLSVLCLDTNEFQDIPAYPWGEENCYIGSINLKAFGCTLAVAQAEYIRDDENLKLSQQLRINTFANAFNRIIESQYTDGGWASPLDTAFGLLVLNAFPTIFPQRIEQAIEYLKLNRDESEKCWPKDQCSVSTTANILFLLEKAGFEDLRVQNDGKLYLQKTQNYLAGKDWTLEIQDHSLNVGNPLNTSCVYEYNTQLSTFNLTKYPDIHSINFSPSYQIDIGVVCTENFVLELYNEFSERLIVYQGDNFTYNIPPACWTLNKENVQCDFRTTGFAVNTELASAQVSAAKSYLSSTLIEDRTAGRHVTTEWDLINDALYLHSLDSGSTADDLIEALLFQQSNNGSWITNDTYYEEGYYQFSDEEGLQDGHKISDNVTNVIISTGYVVMSLIEHDYTRDDEPIDDAARWISLHEDETGLNFTETDLSTEEAVDDFLTNESDILYDTKRNAMAFYVLQNNARPILQSEPKVIRLNTGSVELDIINPTIFNLEGLEYSFSDDIEQYVEVEEKDFIGAYSFRRVTVTRKGPTDAQEVGYLRVSQGGDTYLKVPISVESQPQLNITLPEDLTLFGNTALLPFTVRKSSHDFVCSLEWETEGISSSTTFNIGNVQGTSYEFPVRFAVLQTENKVYEGTITCSASQVVFEIPYAVRINRFSSRPLDVFPKVVVINSSEQAIINVENQLDKSIDVAIELIELDPYVIVSDPFLSLFPGESRNITVEVVPPQGENYSSTNSLTFTSFNIEERVLLDMNLTYVPEKQTPLVVLFVIIAVIISLLATIAFILYKKRDKLLEWYNARFKKEDIRERIYKDVEKVEEQEEHVAIRNMMKILKLQGLGDVEVRKQLQADGYSEEDIQQAQQVADEKASEKKEAEGEKKEEKKS